MVKNNHQFKELESTLLSQDFMTTPQDDILDHYKEIASMYAKVENSIAVLSDLSQNRSYIYYGALASILGLSTVATEEIDSIWEDEIYSLVHPDDLAERNIQELYFFRLLKKTSIEHRPNYITHSTIRMKDASGHYVAITHRTVYLYSQPNGTLWLVLCLYNLAPTTQTPSGFSGVIQDSLTGNIYKPESDNTPILSQREIEVLRLIEQGLLSKEIARTLDLSINTINRHRQNIIERLRVNSSIEAIRKARLLKIID